MILTNTSNRPNPQVVRSFLLNWQKDLCSGLENLQQSLFPDSPPSPFRFDHWQRNGQPDAGRTTDKSADVNSGAKAPHPHDGANGPAGAEPALQGGGISAVAAGGPLWEKAGVNFSHVSGASLPPAASARHPHLAGRTFEAMGVSIVIHPLNPYVPTTHANIRFLSTASTTAGHTAVAPAAHTAATAGQQATDFAGKQDTRDGTEKSAGSSTTGSPENSGAPEIWWFGGGFDLTPYYGFEEDAVHWHKTAQAACQPFGAELYPKFKQWCDRYFYLPHRDEARGIGGLFFDDTTCNGNFDTAFNLSRSIAEALFAAYAPIVERRAKTEYGERERSWQLYRRGRYVEFNLICDRGTHFGLQSRGRTESILMSLPPLVRWEYDYHPEADSPEAALLEQFLPPRDWLAAAQR